MSAYQSELGVTISPQPVGLSHWGSLGIRNTRQILQVKLRTQLVLHSVTSPFTVALLLRPLFLFFAAKRPYIFCKKTPLIRPMVTVIRNLNFCLLSTLLEPSTHF